MTSTVESLETISLTLTLVGGIFAVVFLAAVTAYLVARATPRSFRVVVLDRDDARAWVDARATPEPRDTLLEGL